MLGLDSQHLPILLSTLVMLIALYCTFSKMKELKEQVDRSLQQRKETSTDLPQLPTPKQEDKPATTIQEIDLDPPAA